MLGTVLKTFIPSPVRKVLGAQKKRLTNPIIVPDAPHFETEGLAYFTERIGSCKRYLEYGSGGSTVAVARRGVPFTTVESDRRFLAAVKTKVGNGAAAAERRFLPVDIGMTGDWGYPLFFDQTPARIAKWRRYPWAPWPMSPLPDLVLIDGRFRVACALVSIKHLYDKVDFEILFDDYGDRPHYHAIEEFACLEAMHGRMAVFKQKSIAVDALDSAIEHFSTDYR
jgi:hypothetical protein